jgi:hypothetical protein
VVSGARQPCPIRFEPQIVGEREHIQRSLIELHPPLKRVPQETVADLCLAEALGQKIKRSKNMPPRSVIISFATALEAYLRSVVPALKDKTLGVAAREAGNLGEIAQVAADLKKLNSLRRSAAHRNPDDRELNRDDVKEAQGLVYKIIAQLVSPR